MEARPLKADPAADINVITDQHSGHGDTKSTEKSTNTFWHFLNSSHNLIFVFAAIAAVIVCATFSSGCKKKTNVKDNSLIETRMKMGTIVTLTLYGGDDSTRRSAADAAFAEIDRVNAIFSDYDRNSEVSKLNRNPARRVVVSTELGNILHQSLDLCRTTDGAFDVTVRPLVVLWRKARETGKAPSDSEIQDAMKRTGCEKLTLDMKHKALLRSAGGMELDFGGNAKGYAANRAAAAIKRHGIDAALINAGGDITALGEKPGGKPWVMGIQNPRNPDDYVARIYLIDEAVTTSGDYEKYFQKNGKRESHIVDPRTGHGASETISVTVIAPDAMLADGLSTALSVLGPDDGIKLIEEKYPQAQALIITPDRQLHYSGDFKKYLSPGLR